MADQGKFDVAGLVGTSIDEHQNVFESLRLYLPSLIGRVGHKIAKALGNGGVVYWCGNGGSAADCQHLAAELIGRFSHNRRALRSVALTTDTSVLTCVANDFSYDDIFARQLEGLGNPGDVLVGISTSGNSENVLRALKTANRRGLMTVALLGNDGGKAVSLADHAMVIPSDSIARIQEAHIFIGHVLCNLIEHELNLV